MSLRIGEFVNPAMSVLSLNKATGQTQKALSRLSSGSRIVETSDDAAGAAVALKLEASINRCLATQTNLQNADSFLRTQASALDALGKGVTRLMELKTLCLDSTKNATDLANYGTEFSSLRKALVDISKSKFNGIDLFSHTGSDTYLNLVADENGQQWVKVTQYALEIGTSGLLSSSNPYQFVAGVFTWEDALSDAQSKGGTLASITSSSDWDEASQSLGADSSKCMWIGGFQPPGSSEPLGGWSWTDGKPFGYTNWTTGEPSNNFGFQNYIAVNLPNTVTGTWDDLSNAESNLYIEGYLLNTEPTASSSSSAMIESTLARVANCLANNGAEATAVGVSSDNIRTKSVNLESAKSKIADTDIAKETQSLNKAQILGQIITMLIKQGIDTQKLFLRLVDQR